MLREVVAAESREPMGVRTVHCAPVSRATMAWLTILPLGRRKAWREPSNDSASKRVCSRADARIRQIDTVSNRTFFVIFDARNTAQRSGFAMLVLGNHHSRNTKVLPKEKNREKNAKTDISRLDRHPIDLLLATLYPTHV